jgi:hypothetical protein
MVIREQIVYQQEAGLLSAITVDPRATNKLPKKFGRHPPFQAGFSRKGVRAAVAVILNLVSAGSGKEFPRVSVVRYLTRDIRPQLEELSDHEKKLPRTLDAWPVHSVTDCVCFSRSLDHKGEQRHNALRY